MTVTNKPLIEITRDALSILTEKLGIANTIRFINQFHPGYGDYTKEREKIFKDLDMDTIIEDIKKAKKGKKS
jgi:hypothetical protein